MLSVGKYDNILPPNSRPAPVLGSFEGVSRVGRIAASLHTRHLQMDNILLVFPLLGRFLAGLHILGLHDLLQVQDLRPLAGRQDVVKNLEFCGREDKVHGLPDANEEDEHDGEEDGGLLEGLDQPQADEAEQLGGSFNNGWMFKNGRMLNNGRTFNDGRMLNNCFYWTCFWMAIIQRWLDYTGEIREVG